MQPDSLSTSPTANPTSPAQAESAELSRHRLTRRRRSRRRLLLAGGVLAIGAIAGSGFAISGVASHNAALQETAALNASAADRSDRAGVYSGIAKAHATSSAKATIDAAALALASAEGKVDAAPLAASVASLEGFELLPLEDVATLTKQTQSEISAVQAAVSEHEAAIAAAAAAAAQLAANNTPEGAREVARTMAAEKYGWGADQFAALEKLWQKESGWSYTAYNASSGATGIPQSLPGSKMATAGADWETNAATQIAWGLDYIARGYGSPSGAWAHSQSMNWY